jgi:hypothetical protein
MGLPSFTDLDLYYADPNQFGQYQYSTLEQIINNFMYDQAVTDDSYVSGVDRNRVALVAKRGVRELYYDIVNEVITIELDLDPATLTFALPHDYIQYVGIFQVNEEGKLKPLALDMSNNLAQAYLQDNDYNFLYDIDGDILQGSHIQNIGNQSLGDDLDYPSNGRLDTNPFNVNRAKIFKNGSFRIDKTKGEIQFSSEADGATIVMSYISDGLFQRLDSEIKIHKFAEEAMYDWIYWNLIKRMRSVPRNEKEAARRDWFNSRRIAKRRITPVTYDNVRQILKGSSKWIKD